MAKPDTDDGWLKYAHELDAALACADFSKGARIVLKEVFAQIYGPAKRMVAQIAPSELGRRYGIDKSNLLRAVRELVESNVLIRVDGSGFRFDKHYDRWTKKGRPRFTKLELAAIGSAPDIAISYARISGVSSDTHPENNGVTSDTGGVSQLTPNGVTSDTKTVSLQTPVSHYIERAGELRIRELEKEKERALEIPPGVKAIQTPMPQNPPEAVAALATRSESRWPMQNADRFTGDLCRDYDHRLVAQILDQAYAKDPRKFSMGWVRNGCQNQFNAGWKPPASNLPPAVVAASVDDITEHYVQKARAAGWKG
jgi:Bacteriophage replication protein O